MLTLADNTVVYFDSVAWWLSTIHWSYQLINQEVVKCLYDMQPVKKQYDIIPGRFVNMVYWYMEHSHVCAWSMVLEAISLVKCIICNKKK